MRFGVVLAIGLSLPMGAFAQDRAQTLADIRQEMSVLFVEVQRLKTELSTTGSPGVDTGGSGALARIDAIEAEMRRLTSQTEALQLRVENVVRDGTNRIGDLEFRLCELEEACDIGKLGETSTLGGAAPVVAAPAAPETPAQPSTSGSFALGEQGDFDRAKAAFDAGNYAEAATAFGAFTQTYSGGPLNAEAHFLRGEALTKQGQWPGAARAYLDAFSNAPDGMRAPTSLLNLGLSLAELGQTDEACLTLSEVPARYASAPEALEANAARTKLGCQ